MDAPAEELPTPLNVSIGPQGVPSFSRPPAEVDPDRHPDHRNFFLALRQYLAATARLRQTTLAQLQPILPPHLGAAIRLYAIRCDRGILLRFDPAPDLSDSQIYFLENGAFDWRDACIVWSNGFVRFEGHTSAIEAAIGAPTFTMWIGNQQTGDREELTSHPLKQIVPAEIRTDTSTSFRPAALLEAVAEFSTGVAGITGPPDCGSGSLGPFETHSVFRPWAWHVLEFYEHDQVQRWTPEIAEAIAERDMLFVAVKVVAASNSLLLRALTGPRTWFEQAIQTLERLISSDETTEEQLQQHIGTHSWILAFNAKRVLPKVKFGDRISDFVVERADGTYQLVELELHTATIFVKKGDYSAPMNHAIGQIEDWVRYIADNKRTVEHELGLRGIAVSPAKLVVIGRDREIDQRGRAKLTVTQTDGRGLAIWTYDELVRAARANLETFFRVGLRLDGMLIAAAPDPHPPFGNP